METDEKSNLLVIKASGISENDNVGIPKLILTGDKQDKLSSGILEFNFIIQGAETGPKKKMEWDIAVVYRMDILPKGIKAIKVNAAKNADIAMLLN
jgi:hypothetical protein